MSVLFEVYKIVKFISSIYLLYYFPLSCCIILYYYAVYKYSVYNIDKIK